MPRVILFATTTGYQVRAFHAAAGELGVDLQIATDRCDQLDDPWRDSAIAVRFHQPEQSVDAVVAAHRQRAFDGVLAVGDRPAALAARVARELGIRWHSPEAAEISRSKLKTRECLRAAGLPTPAFAVARSEGDLAGWTERGPVVVKPVALSGSRGVIRADTTAPLRQAWARVRRLLDLAGGTRASGTPTATPSWSSPSFQAGNSRSKACCRGAGCTCSRCSTSRTRSTAPSSRRRSTSRRRAPPAACSGRSSPRVDAAAAPSGSLTGRSTPSAA